MKLWWTITPGTRLAWRIAAKPAQLARDRVAARAVGDQELLRRLPGVAGVEVALEPAVGPTGRGQVEDLVDAGGEVAEVDPAAPNSSIVRVMPKQWPPDDWTICSMICHFKNESGFGIGVMSVQS